jgi:hypothetical protein
MPQGGPIVEGCAECVKVKDGICTVYASPEAIHRRGGCYFNQKTEAVKKGKVNPLKASKRAGKGHK